MVFRICADGTLQSKKHGGWTGSINPGDAIVVPEKIIKIDGFGTSFITALKDWTNILYQFGIGAAGPTLFPGFYLANVLYCFYDFSC